MHKAALSVGGLLLLAAGSLSAAPCAPSPTTLCLNASRFEVAVSWRDSRGRTGVGQAKTITADTGYFWFFSETNIELVIKVLDARSINQKYWVFFGALTSVEFDLTVTDTVTGAVKTYHNPLGQFASVGDTGAFDPSVTAPLHETLATEGTQTPPDSLEAIQSFIDAPLSKSAEAFTPCPDTGALLYLANCRFRLDVHWSDARGRHGAGRPVQLTNDTGYFWFFSDANVELMVKVLDARAINGKFWVFFGALTNVEYTLRVTDTVSGALGVYQNPPSTFASVGDTSAFRSGGGITVEIDEDRAVSGAISADAGGSLSVTSVDGTVFTLEVPSNSLSVDEYVTMTPVRRVSGFPFAGGLVAGVDIQPSGIPLLEGASLSIHTPTPLSPSDETLVAWNGSGEDFFLFPPWPTPGDLQLRIFHFGGYGVARGTDAERQAQLDHEPVAEGDRMSHEISLVFREERAGAAGAATLEPKRTNDRASTIARLDSQYQELKARMQLTLISGDPTQVVWVISQTKQWMVQVTAVGPLEQLFPGRTDEIYRLFKGLISAALLTIHERCFEDPFEILLIQEITQVIRAERLADRFPGLYSELEQVYRCLKFELRFESTIVLTGDSGKTFTNRVLADPVPLRVDPGDPLTARMIGEGPLNNATLEFEGNANPCTVTYETGASTFKAALTLRFRPNHDAILQYDPGTPKGTITIHCPGRPPLPPIDTPWEIWLPTYTSLRVISPNEYSSGSFKFQRDGWSITGNRDPWAVKTVTYANPGLAEITTFTLKHTPE